MDTEGSARSLLADHHQKIVSRPAQLAGRRKPPVAVPVVSLASILRSQAIRLKIQASSIQRQAAPVTARLVQRKCLNLWIPMGRAVRTKFCHTRQIQQTSTRRDRCWSSRHSLALLGLRAPVSTTRSPQSGAPSRQQGVRQDQGAETPDILCRWHKC